jgi:prevent-host-death family protein
MIRANISYTRNHLSELVARVKAGEAILIVDRHQPVARLEPLSMPAADTSDWQASFLRRGLIRPARQKLDREALRALPLPTPRRGGDILRAVLAEREDGR